MLEETTSFHDCNGHNGYDSVHRMAFLHITLPKPMLSGVHEQKDSAVNKAASCAAVHEHWVPRLIDRLQPWTKVIVYRGTKEST